MKASNSIAFKEWAVVCTALGDGLQSILLRKGGMHEGREGFRVEHREFWLFPTYLHQDRSALTNEGARLLERVLARRPAEGMVRVEHYAVVEEVIELGDEPQALRLAGQHIGSAATVSARFHYRRPGLSLLAVRAYRLARPLELPHSPHFAGCRTWVDLPTDYATDGAEPVLGEAEFAQRLADVHAAIRPVRLA